MEFDSDRSSQTNEGGIVHPPQADSSAEDLSSSNLLENEAQDVNEEEHKSEQPSLPRRKRRLGETDSKLVSTNNRRNEKTGPLGKFSSKHALKLIEAMTNLRENGMLCDVVVKSGTCELHAHKVVLAACSEYFRACLTGGMREAERGVVDLSGMAGTGVDGVALRCLVDFAYTGVVAVTEGNALELLVAANQLEMPEVLTQCCDFLLNRMDAQNCLGILNLATTYSCSRMRQLAEAFAHRHFEEVSKSDEFLNLGLDNLLQLLESDALSVSSEEVVAEAALRWLQFDPVRLQSGGKGQPAPVVAVLKALRLPLLSTAYLADRLQSHPSIIGCPEALPLLLSAYQFHCRTLSPDPVACREHRTKALKAYVRKAAVRPVIYAVGGDDGHDDRHPYKCTMFLHASLGEWIRVADLNQSRSVCGVAACKGEIYAVGGYDGERALDSVEAFDPVENSWRRVPSMHQRRCSCVCATLDDQLYVVGGVCGPVALRDVERYDPIENMWVNCSPMTEGRSGCGVAGASGLLYAVGGINGQGETVATAECYNPRTHQWAPLQPMNHPRRSFGLAALNGQLYACGGNDGFFDLNSLEVYNPATNRWRVLTGMSRARMYCSVGVLDGKLYAVGGLEGETTLNLVECYDPKEDCWQEYSPLERNLCGCGVAVLDCTQQKTHRQEGMALKPVPVSDQKV